MFYYRKESKYYDESNRIVTDQLIIDQIKKMAIPPAYRDVKINLNPNAKIIYEGYDSKDRLQQKYSKDHSSAMSKKKFCRLIQFGNAFPKLQADLLRMGKSERNTKNKIISIVLNIIWLCGFRVGNIKYQILYESFGISTILKKHLTFTPTQCIIEFKGKKSVINRCCINNREIIEDLESLVRNKTPDDYVFLYTEKGEEKLIKSGVINNFLLNYGEITTKDLRTFDVNILFIDFVKDSLKLLQSTKSISGKKKILKQALEVTSSHINNTVGICKSSYLLADLYTLALEPDKFKKLFEGDSRKKFISFLKNVYCKI